MARTTAGAELTQVHRRQQLALRAALLRDLTRLWPLFDPADLDTFGAFVDVAAVLLAAGHRESAALAARYFGAFRMAEGLAGEVPIRLADPPPRERIAISLRATGLVGTIIAARAGLPFLAAKRNGFVRVAGAAGSLVLDGGRRTIIETAAGDRAARRWQRVTSTDPCAFCRMLASRGAVFRSEATADFKAHGACSCVPEPAYEGSRLPTASQRFREEWDEATAGLSGRDAINAFRRAVEGENSTPAGMAA